MHSLQLVRHSHRGVVLCFPHYVNSLDIISTWGTLPSLKHEERAFDYFVIIRNFEPTTHIIYVFLEFSCLEARLHGASSYSSITHFLCRVHTLSHGPQNENMWCQLYPETSRDYAPGALSVMHVYKCEYFETRCFDKRTKPKRPRR